MTPNSSELENYEAFNTPKQVANEGHRKEMCSAVSHGEEMGEVVVAK